MHIHIKFTQYKCTHLCILEYDYIILIITSYKIFPHMIIYVYVNVCIYMNACICFNCDIYHLYQFRK